MCGCNHDNATECARAALMPGETLRPCGCKCHARGAEAAAARPVPDVAAGAPGSKDPAQALAMVLSELSELIGGGAKGIAEVGGNVLLSIGNFAIQCDDARATAALCYAGADALRAARKVLG